MGSEMCIRDRMYIVYLATFLKKLCVIQGDFDNVFHSADDCGGEYGFFPSLSSRAMLYIWPSDTIDRKFKLTLEDRDRC